jgi:hypothetical protein
MSAVSTVGGVRARSTSAAASRSSGGGIEPNQEGQIVEIFQELARDRMQTILRTRTLRGCPLNIPFTDVDGVLDYIKSLCIHESKHPEVQFVLAVRAFPLVNNIVSLWLFVGTLETRSPR